MGRWRTYGALIRPANCSLPLEDPVKLGAYAKGHLIVAAHLNPVPRAHIWGRIRVAHWLYENGALDRFDRIH